MKKITLGLLSLLALGATAQTIPNNDFEIWVMPGGVNGTFEDPVQWQSSDSILKSIGQASNVIKDDVNHYTGSGGSYTPLLTTTSFLYSGFTVYATGALTNGTITFGGSPIPTFQFTGGSEYTERPGTLAGYYKYIPQGTDSCFISVMLTKWVAGARTTIASGSMWQNNAVPDFELFEIPLNYVSADTPDSMLIYAVSSKRKVSFSGSDSSMLWIDDLEFRYNAGIDDVSAAGSVNVYPNPATNRLMLDIPSDVYTAAYIFDMTGRQVSTLNLQGNSVDVSALNKGQYIIELRNRSGVLRSTFAKQ